MIENEIYNYDIGVYDELNFETNKTVENTQIS
jgi:hypothetical protein